MNSRQRVASAVNHLHPDRVPIDLGGQAASGINISAYIRLKRFLGMRTENIRVQDVFAMAAHVEPEVIEYFHTDTMMVPSLCPRFDIPIKEYRPWQLFDGSPVLVPIGFQPEAQADGSLVLMVGGQAVGKMPKDAFYFSELANSTVGTLDSLVEPPDPERTNFPLFTDEDLRFRQEAAETLFKATDKALIVDVADNLRWNTSIPNWLYALGVDPTRVDELHEKKSLNLIERFRQLAEAVGPHVDVLAVYQDLGTQRGEMISPTMFERFMVPHYKRMFSWIHENTAWKILFHSCGSIHRLIPHMIEMGVDILNPVQVTASNMDPKLLKAEFGDRLVFWGGGADTQSVLPFGTPDEVRRQVRERISILGAGGGFVFAPTQDIQADVPPQNLVAMYEAVAEYGQYPLEVP